MNKLAGHHGSTLRRRSCADRRNTNGWILPSVYTLHFCSCLDSAESRHSSTGAHTEARRQAAAHFQRKSTDGSDSGSEGLRLHCRDPYSVYGRAYDCPSDCPGTGRRIYSVSLHATDGGHLIDCTAKGNLSTALAPCFPLDQRIEALRARLPSATLALALVQCNCWWVGRFLTTVQLTQPPVAFCRYIAASCQRQSLLAETETGHAKASLQCREQADATAFSCFDAERQDQSVLASSFAQLLWTHYPISGVPSRRLTFSDLVQKKIDIRRSVGD